MESPFAAPLAIEPVQRDLPPWKVRDTLVGLILTQVPVMAVLIGSNFLPQQSSTSTSTPTPTQTAIIITAIILGLIEAVGEVVFIIAPLYYARKRGKQAGAPAIGYQALGFRGFNPLSAFGWIILGFIVTYAVAILYDIVLQLLHLNAQTNVQQLSSANLPTPELLAVGAVAVLVAPICEELFFRGFVLQGLRKAMPAGWAIFLSGIIFALAHVAPGTFVLLLVSGWWMGFLRVRTRSIWPSFLFHTLNNAISIGALLLVTK